MRTIDLYPDRDVPTIACDGCGHSYYPGESDPDPCPSCTGLVYPDGLY